MKEKKSIAIIFILSIVSLLFLASSSTTCDNIIDISYSKGISTQQTTIFKCTNSLNSPMVTLSKGGSASSYFTLDNNILELSSNVSTTMKTFNISFDENAEEGNYVGIITFSDSSPPLSFLLTVNPAISSGGCFINPSLVSYNQQIQQGTKIQIPKITFNPINCPSQLILTPSSVSIQGGIVTPNGQKPVFISSVESDGINVDINTDGLNSQTYNSKLKISAFNKQFEIPFTIVVTGGTGTTGQLDINNLPKCSLTNTIININNTHSLVCTNLIPDISIIPKIDSNFIRGINYAKESNQFTWTFQGKKFGNTKIIAEFLYLGVPVGDPFEQEVKIQAQSNQIPGTQLKLLFTPGLNTAKEHEGIAIQIVDNNSNSLVENPNLFIDAIPITNSSGRTFFYSFSTNKNYTIRASATGYNDIVENVALTSQPIILTITPETGDTRTTFTITTDINATIYLNGDNKSIIYTGYIPYGNNTIRAVKEGFFDVEKSFYVDEAPSIFTSGEFKKGVLQTFTLNKNLTWKVSYKKNAESSPELITEGVGNKIEFTPSKVGLYTTQAGDINRVDEIVGYNWNTKWGWFEWYYWVGGLVFGIILIRFMKGGSSSDDQLPFGANIKG